MVFHNKPLMTSARLPVFWSMIGVIQKKTAHRNVYFFHTSFISVNFFVICFARGLISPLFSSTSFYHLLALGHVQVDIWHVPRAGAMEDHPRITFPRRRRRDAISLHMHQHHSTKKGWNAIAEVVVKNRSLMQSQQSRYQISSFVIMKNIEIIKMNLEPVQFVRWQLPSSESH